MAQLTKYRIRLPLKVLSHEPVRCVLQGTTPLIWRGVSVDIECAIFFGDDFVTDIGNVVSITLQIHEQNARSSSPLIQKTIEAVDLNTTLTEEDWNGNEPDDCHVKFELDNDDTHFDMTGHSQWTRSFWLVVHATLDDGSYITLGSTLLKVEEDATQEGLSVLGVSAGNFRVKAGGWLQLKDSETGKFTTIYTKNGEIVLAEPEDE